MKSGLPRAAHVHFCSFLNVSQCLQSKQEIETGFVVNYGNYKIQHTVSYMATIFHSNMILLGTTAYQLGNTSSRTITEVKQH